MSKFMLSRRAILAGGAATIPVLATAFGVAAAAPVIPSIAVEAASTALVVTLEQSLRPSPSTGDCGENTQR